MRLRDSIWMLPAIGGSAVILVALVMVSLVGTQYPSISLVHKEISRSDTSAVASTGSQTGSDEDARNSDQGSGSQAQEKRPSLPDLFVHEFGARVLWIVSTTALWLGLIALIAIGIQTLRLYQSSMRGVFITSAAALLIALLAGLFSWLDAKPNSFAWGILRETEPHMLVNYFHTLDGFAAAPMVFFIAGTSCIARVVLRSESMEKSAARNRLAIANRYARLLLAAACAVLVSAIIELFAIHNWIAAQYELDTDRMILEGVTVEAPSIRLYGIFMALALGAGFSLFLTTVYVPAAIIVRDRGLALAQEELGVDSSIETRDKWLYSNWLSPLPRRAIVRSIVLLSPMLAGLLGSLIELLLSGMLRLPQITS